MIHGLIGISFRAPFRNVLDLDEERAKTRAGLIKQGVFRLSTERSNVMQTVIHAYVNNPSLHKLEVRVKFENERCGWPTQLFGISINNGWMESLKRFIKCFPIP